MNYERMSAMWIHLFSKKIEWLLCFLLLWRSERWEKWSEAKEIPRCWCSSWFSVEKYANRKSFPRQLSRDKQRGTFCSGFSTECEQAWCQACTSRATCCPSAFATANMGEHLRLSGRGQVPSPVVKVKASTFHWENLWRGSHQISMMRLFFHTPYIIVVGWFQILGYLGGTTCSNSSAIEVCRGTTKWQWLLYIIWGRSNSYIWLLKQSRKFKK